MTKDTGMDEVSVVRFFENGPIEKAEVVFNIVADKMKERLRSRNEPETESAVVARRRPASRTAASTPEDLTPPSAG